MNSEQRSIFFLHVHVTVCALSGVLLSDIFLEFWSLINRRSKYRFGKWILYEIREYITSSVGYISVHVELPMSTVNSTQNIGTNLVCISGNDPESIFIDSLVNIWRLRSYGHSMFTYGTSWHDEPPLRSFLSLFQSLETWDECAVAVSSHETLDSDEFLMSDSSFYPCKWSNTVSEQIEKTGLQHTGKL